MDKKMIKQLILTIIILIKCFFSSLFEISQGLVWIIVLNFVFAYVYGRNIIPNIMDVIDILIFVALPACMVVKYYQLKWIEKE